MDAVQEEGIAAPVFASAVKIPVRLASASNQDERLDDLVLEHLLICPGLLVQVSDIFLFPSCLNCSIKSETYNFFYYGRVKSVPAN